MADMAVFKKFPSTAHAEPFIELLDTHQIDYLMEKTAPLFDPFFSQNPFKEEVVIKLKLTDFEAVTKLFQQSEAPADLDHYLYSFTDNELIEIVLKPYEWNEYDYTLAQKILKDRGKEVNTEVVSAIRKNSIEEIAKKETAPTVWIWAGYIFGVVGGLIGFFIGWHLRSHTKTLPDGRILSAYDEGTRNHGTRIMILGGIGVVVWGCIRLKIWFP